MAIDPQEALELKIASRVISTNHDRYLHYKFTERDDPVAANDAWRIHAEGYLTMHFVHQSALTADGFLAPEIDKARGENVEYYLAVNPANPDDAATMRKVHIPAGGDFQDLPAYQLTKDYLSAAGLATLSHIGSAGKTLKELSALSKRPRAKFASVYEILRKAQHDAIGQREVWFFSVVSSTYDSVATSFGRSNFEVIGHDAPIPDDRVNAQVLLRPTLLYPDTFIDTLYRSYELESESRQKRILERGFLFFTEGLERTRMSDTVYRARQNVLRQLHDKRPASKLL